MKYGLVCAVAISSVLLCASEKKQAVRQRRQVSFSSSAWISSKRDNTQVVTTFVAYLKHRAAHRVCDAWCEGKCFKSPMHPLINAGEKPYQKSNGGLVNPKLTIYSVTSTDVTVRTWGGSTVKGIVEFDGLVAAREYAKTVDNMSLLEQVILGYLSENQNGDQRSYTSFLVDEFNCHLDDSDDGKRGESQFIECYFSQFHTKKKSKQRLRIGRLQSKALSKEAGGACVKVTVMQPIIKIETVTAVAEKGGSQRVMEKYYSKRDFIFTIESITGILTT